jgi:copper chaperone CopZ
MSLTPVEVSHTSTVQLLLGGVHEVNREYVSKRLSEHIDGLIACRFLDDNNLTEILYDTEQVDQFTLFSGIQRLGYSVQMLNSASVQAQLRIDGMHCNSCVSNICDAVRDLPGALDIQLTFLDKLATIIYDPSILQLDDIISEIEKNNFKVAVSNGPQSDSPTATPTTDRASGKSSPCAFPIRIACF